jgi:hypothetical protein
MLFNYQPLCGSRTNSSLIISSAQMPSYAILPSKKRFLLSTRKHRSAVIYCPNVQGRRSANRSPNVTGQRTALLTKRINNVTGDLSDPSSERLHRSPNLVHPKVQLSRSVRVRLPACLQPGQGIPARPAGIAPSLPDVPCGRSARRCAVRRAECLGVGSPHRRGRVRHSVRT